MCLYSTHLLITISYYDEARNTTDVNESIQTKKELFKSFS
ncbi:hypothetical protein EDO6_03968 [Paenibacillus xylanexedens]|nr:hypothetical protein EDO6_03968 [Paenibacillus xylanexedens]